ncbi:MAG: glycosyltransferase [Polyangiaceae bacterium]
MNDTARNGGPGRTLHAILKHTDPARVFRSVVLPRPGVVSELLEDDGVADALAFEPGIVENAVEPWGRAIRREDFDAAAWLRAVRLSGNVGRGTSAVFRLAKKVKDDRIDVVFCNGTSANFLGGALAKLTGVPVVWHVFYTSVGAPIRRLHGWLAADPKVRSILCVSRPTTIHFDHCRDKVAVTHDAIDVQDYVASDRSGVLRRELAFGDDVVVVGSQGRVVPKKGYVELVRATELAVREGGAHVRARLRVVVLGDTPEDSRENHLETCRALVRSAGLEDVVHFCGYRSDVRPYVADFDVAAVPSVYEDPLPRSVLEAMALGKPVVAFDRGGIDEMIADGESGALVPGRPPDVRAFAEAMLRYLHDPELRRAHGAKGRTIVEREFDARVHGERIVRELEKVAGARSS